MKNLTFLFMIFALFANAVLAQNYQSVYSDREAFFALNYGEMRAIRIDSIAMENSDTLLFSHKMLREIQVEDNIIGNLNGDSWIGKKIQISENGNNIFYNQDNQPILIKTLAEVGESWEAFTVSSNAIIWATVESKTEETFLGLTDSVKTIRFQLYDENHTPISDTINGETIKISKHYGLIKTLCFYIFPEPFVHRPSAYYLVERLSPYYLVGLSKPEVGKDIASTLDIFNFDIGDIIHTREEVNYAYANGLVRIIKQELNYINKEITNDYCTYTIARKIHKKETSFNIVNYNIFLIDTIEESYPVTSIFHYPMEAYQKYVPYIGNLITCNTQNYSERTEILTFEYYFEFLEDNWYRVWLEGCLNESSYFEGLGGPYYYCEDWTDKSTNMTGFRKMEYVYYKKGEEEYGIPLNLTDVEEVTESNFRIYPNPANEFITIETSSLQNNTYLFELLDISGKTVLKTTINNSPQTIQLPATLQGLYIYRVIENDKAQCGKIIIE